MKKIILIDGHNLLFRMFYGIPSPIKNSKGKDIRGLIGFIGSLKKIVNEFNPYSICVIFDSETSKNSNIKIDKSYKENRIDYSTIPLENNPFSQLSMIKKALDYLDIFYIEVEKYEADDFIASIVSKKNVYEYIIVSTDSDYIQLIKENIRLYVPRGKKSILYDKEEVINRYHVFPEQYVIFKSLTGDKSDNICGVKGIGKVIASKILAFSSIDEFISNNQSSRYSTILRTNETVIERNIRLISMNKNLDISKIEFKKLSHSLLKDKTYEIIQNIDEN